MVVSGDDHQSPPRSHTSRLAAIGAVTDSACRTSCTVTRHSRKVSGLCRVRLTRSQGLQTLRMQIDATVESSVPVKGELPWGLGYCSVLGIRLRREDNCYYSKHRLCR